MIPIIPLAGNIYRHSYWSNAFDSLQLEDIMAYCETKDEDAKVTTQNSKETGDCFRTATVTYLEHTEEARFFIEALVGIVRSLNSKIYNFDITGVFERLQYSVYNVGDHYETWHQDAENPTEEMAPRKISLSLQLSRPEDYEGGELQMGGVRDMQVASKEFGSITLFPSFLPHCITPVTKGIRKSIVMWTSGPTFR